ncbi:hypothetical protein Cadr_000020024, partial [Camelus dromedarius]
MKQFITHRRRFEECHRQMREAEITWRHQVTCLPLDTPTPQHLMQTVTVALRTPRHGVFLDVLTFSGGSCREKGPRQLEELVVRFVLKPFFIFKIRCSLQTEAGRGVHEAGAHPRRTVQAAPPRE